MKLLYAVCLGLLALVGCGSQEEPSVEPVVTVTTTRAQEADVRSLVRAPAYIFAREQANISSRVTAPIRNLLVRKGDTVTAGQLLAQLDNPDLLAQRDEAAAAVTDAEANLDRLKAGTLPSDIERARGQLAVAEAALNQAQKFYERRHKLFEQGAIPQRDLVTSETDFAAAKANYEVARISLALLENPSREKDILMAKSKVEQARARLAAIAAQVEFTAIRSRWNGVVTEQFMYPGDMAKPDAPIFTVMDLSVAVARAQIPESQAAPVHSGEECWLVPGDAPESRFEGRISVVNQAVDAARRTVEAWCEIPNSGQALRSGVFGEVSVVTHVTPRSVVVPIAAVQFGPDGNTGVVMVADPQGKAVKREVSTGERFDGKVEVRNGVSAGEQVIVVGAYGLADGTRIHVREAGKQ